MIGPEQRAALGDLAMRAFDAIAETYGEDATLEDAVLIFEVSLPDGTTELNAETTTHRVTVTGGMAQAYARQQFEGWDPE